MAAMCETELFREISPGSKWIFDPFGATPDELTGRINKGHAVCVCTTHVTQQQSPPYVWVYVHVHHPMYDKMISCMSPVGGCACHRIVPY